MTDTQNEQRANMAEYAVDIYAECKYGGASDMETPDDVVIDLVTDLLHLCNSHEYDIARTLRLAKENHREEFYEAHGTYPTYEGESDVPATRPDPSPAPFTRERGRHIEMG